MYRGDDAGFATADFGGADFAGLRPAGGAVAEAPAVGLRALLAGHRGGAAARWPGAIVDLGSDIGARAWWRGMATLVGLCASALVLAPVRHPIDRAAMPAISRAQAAELRARGLAPLAYGADALAPHMREGALVEHLADTPERPRIDLSATLRAGDGLARALERAGVGADEAREAAGLVAARMPLDELKPGTRVALTLGRRPNRDVARPLDHLDLRAKLELALSVERQGGRLVLVPHPIAVDETPLRLSGRVGASLFAAARAAGAPIGAVEAYLKAMAQHLSVARDIRDGDRYDLILAHRRAATGETETGGLLYAGLDQGKRVLRLLKWTLDGREQWFDAAGVGESHGEMKMPVAGHQTSSFGMRYHPILGYSRMHQGVDYGAPYGAPIVAATDGVVRYAGWHGGHGNFVSIEHAGGLGSGYAHMSRIVARAGERVRAGQIIGYVGSTGLSTGPHLHFEVYRNGAAVNPATVKFVRAAQLAGESLGRFRATLARLLSVRAR